MLRRSVPYLLAALFALSCPAGAGASEHNHAGHGSKVVADSAWVEATVKKVDAPTGKITLAHGPLTNLNMPAMTMAFAVKDGAWLKRLQAGDKIRFKADDIGGVITVVQIDGAK